MGKIQLTKVRKSFGEVDVIPGIDLTIENGEFVVFVGPSGCGKSTLLRLIAGLEETLTARTRPRCHRRSGGWRWCSRATPCTRT